jgi:shikimate dehydrogenase
MSATERQTRHVLLGLIGAPIRHSASPAMHEAAAAALGWKGYYQLIEIAGADAALLRKLLDGVRLLGFAGVNVTYPYKEAVLPLLDELSEAARMIGAVNTVVVRDGRLIGHNTDVSGFERAAAALLAESPGPVAVIGAGGVGKAAAVAMAKSGVSGLRIFDLDRAKAAALADIVAPLTDSVVAGTVAEAVSGANGLVNGTPVGMLPNRESPVDPALLRSDLWVADAVYYPLSTPLLVAAQRIGARTLNGRALAIHQAVDAFELFTGVEPSVEVMSAAFDAVLEARADEKTFK